MATIRPMGLEDVPYAVPVAMAAFADEVPDPREPAQGMTSGDGAAIRQRHFVTHYPGGAWVAEQDGAIVGVALALRHVGSRRDDRGYWGLSLLVVRPDLQARGVGRQLLDAALSLARPGDAKVIISSTDPRAMRRYAAVGLELHPTVRAIGAVDPARLPPFPDVVLGGAADLGGSRRDRPHGARLVYAAPTTRPRWPRAARSRSSPAAATPGSCSGVRWRCTPVTRMRRSSCWPRRCRASARPTPRPNSEVLWLRAGMDWATRTCLAAGMALQPYGPVFTSDVTLSRLLIPNGAYL